MRKIVAGLFMSLDAVVENPEQWQSPYFDPEMGQILGAQLAAADTLLLGRRTYEIFASAWPAQAGTGNPMADQLNAIAKLVPSTTLTTLDWQNSTLLTGDIMTKLARLKDEPGNNIQVTGSITLVRSLLRADLLDELQLLVHPVLVGHGAHLLEDPGEPISLAVTGSQTLASGVLSLTYRSSTH